MKRPQIFHLSLMAVLLSIHSMAAAEFRNPERLLPDYSALNVDMLWMYGGPNSWGMLGHDLEGNPVRTAEGSAETFYEWGTHVETALNRQNKMRWNADIILLSGRGYNPLADETAQLILDEADRRGRSDQITVSFDVNVPTDWTMDDLAGQIEQFMSGETPYVSREFLETYGDRVFLSIDLEMPSFYGEHPIYADDVNQIYALYDSIHPAENPPMTVYNFSNMYAEPLELLPPIQILYNGIGWNLDVLADRYQNVVNTAQRPVGIMVFMMPHLGGLQRNRAFGEGDIYSVIQWMLDNDIHPPILGFQ